VSDQYLDIAVDAARRAGEAILSFYGGGAGLDYKEDGSPITQADRAAHAVIAACLRCTGLPVVSEEGSDLHLEARRYWLVDPLDGTKDFLARNGEFTVNIALVDAGAPVLGVVYAPAGDELFAGVPGSGAWYARNGVRTDCTAVGKSRSVRVAVSRFHDSPEVDFFAEANGVGERVAIGSALKYGRLAQGTVDVFPRLVGSSEWDTAAGQAVLEAAGGQVLDWHSGQPLRYGKQGRRNQRLLALRAPYQYGDFALKQYGPELL